ncbi:RNA-binding protein [Mycoplasma sp. Pen4]|uniref:RNA-binding protein n=1 Tax=Mycoplasma sp. Pen4 TaxID=640330 RepID=UPI001654100D|nr:RNA-binding protein [Mycoplasma sp. Pen4]QNM93877.1 RNA-binding protein [Mycoplasma sp. Pen4]
MIKNINYKQGDVATGKVIKTGLKFIVVQDRFSNEFIIYKKEVTDYIKNKLTDIFTQGEIINFIVLSYNPKKSQGQGSFKRNHPNHVKRDVICNIKKCAELKETSSGFANLYTHMMSSLEENNESNNKIELEISNEVE